MTRYFAGNTLGAFFRNQTDIVEVTTAGRFDSAFVPNGISIGLTASGYAETWPFSATGTVWSHFELYVAHINSNSVGPTWMNGTTNVFRLLYNGSGVFQAQYWTGGAWVNTGSTFTLATSTLPRIDVKITLNSGYEVYSMGALVASGSGWSGGQTTITSLRLYSPFSNNSGTVYSQVLIASFDTRDSRYSLDQPTAIGALTSGTGLIGDVTEAVLDESTSWALSASAQRRSATHATYTPPTGYQISALCVSGRGRSNGAGPTDGKFGVRKTTAGMNYTGSALGYNAGFEPRGAFWETDPATSTSWSTAAYNDSQTYFEAA
jgi:hypothetical protein